MRSFLFFVLASYAVRCDENYYVIEIPEEPTSRASKPFNVYWNVPTMQCTSKNVPFKNLDRFGIIQNTGDTFRGDKIAILYDPGLFPALLKDDSSGKYKFRNGGVPQEGNLDKHLEAFKDILETSVPDADFNGVGIIDFESWRPVFRQNFGVLEPYKDVSLEIERKLHWWWPKAWMQAEAKRRFEEAGRTFMQETISLAQRMRPRAEWGYYGFPYCFNMAANNMVESCSDTVKKENDGLDWLWSSSSALFPSVYSAAALGAARLRALLRGRVAEAARVRRGARLLPYFWFRYREGGYFSQDDLDMALKTFYKSEADGFIIWGSSNDVNTVEKCTQLRNYIETVMGPAIAKYASNDTRRENDVIDDLNHNNTKAGEIHVTKNKTEAEPDSEYNWVPPENYTQDIAQHVKELIKNNRHNNSDGENEAIPEKERSTLLNLILHLIMNENENNTQLFEELSESSTRKNDERETTENYSTEDYSTTINTTEQSTESTTQFLSTTSQDFVVTTAGTTTASTSENDSNIDVTFESTKYSTERTTQTESIKETTEITSTTDNNDTENNRKKILDVNITELLINEHLSKNTKKDMTSNNHRESSTKDEVGDAKNDKKGLPKRDLEESTTSDAPFVHQVPGSTASEICPLVSMVVLLVIYGL